jgi:pimeloyl-ACP methyl ester carboxylesterase
MKFSSIVLLAIFLAAPAAAKSQARKAAASKPASSIQMVLPSHGDMLLGIFYLAGGAGPHPTAVLLHGFPGYEQNLDIAQYLRARGWNVLAMHYRGSWGVKGDFSFEHAVQDSDAQVRFVLDPANARKYGINTRRVIVIGHSMGGYMAAAATAHNKGVAGVVLISAWDPSADYDGLHAHSAAQAIAEEAKVLAADDNMLPLAGTSAEALAREIYDHRAALNMNHFAAAIAPRPVFLITAHDGSATGSNAFAQALRKAGDTRIAERHWNTDHDYSGQRVALSRAIFDWAQTVPAR